ncbi:MAG TPA: hypothetical protein VF627_03245 [Abditibacterium sp.]|jgi:hypothetical protein
MKISTRFFLCAVTLGALAWPSQALTIGYYPGLDALIKEADIIAIIRVESSTLTIEPNGWIRPNCYVYQTLKGDLKAQTNLPLSLNGAVSVNSSFSGDAFAPMTTHLVFLDASRSIICREGSDVPLSPLGNETKPAGKTLKAQIQTLIRRYKTYRDAQIKRENQLLDKALAE